MLESELLLMLLRDLRLTESMNKKYSQAYMDMLAVAELGMVWLVVQE